MLAGEAVLAIWHGVEPEARELFYDWHVNEHMPERVGIPGFRRGRRYVAADTDTAPEFLTLYEADAMPVLQGVDYASRMNDPTPLTRAITGKFVDTFRALARVLVSHGPGMGGALLTVRFECDDQNLIAVRAMVRAASQARHVTGAHLCLSDKAASLVQTTETRDRADLRPPPGCFVCVEATEPEALTDILLERALLGAGAIGPFVRGVYRLEHVRTKTAFAP